MNVKNYGPANSNKIFRIHKRKFHSHTNRTQTPAPTPRRTFFVHTYTPHATRTKHAFFLITELLFSVGRDGSFRVSNLGGGEIFPFLSRPALGPTMHPVQWEPIPFLGIKRPGRSADEPSLSSTVLKERLPLPLWAFTVCSGFNLTFTALSAQFGSIRSQCQGDV